MLFAEWAKHIPPPGGLVYPTHGYILDGNSCFARMKEIGLFGEKYPICNYPRSN